MNEPISDKPHATAESPHQPAWRQKSVLWWAMICVPVIVVLGLLSGQLSGSGEGDPWFDALIKPDIYPPGWLFGAVWTILYAMMGFALALVLASDRKAHKKSALTMFGAQLVVNLLWSPIFFGMHLLLFGFIWLVLLVVLVLSTIAYFARVSPLAAVLLVPYLAWIAFASVLNLQFWQLN